MTVYLVGAGPGDPGLLTVKAAEVLRRADVVLYDRLSVASLLDLAPPEAERISVGKTPDGDSVEQDEINRLLVEHGRTAGVVVRLKGGDPFVFARGGEEAAALAEAGIAFEVIPGITSAVAVPAYAGVPVTMRGLATSFTVVTGHEDPWAATETDWEAVARVGGTIVVLMGVATRGAIAERLIAGGLDPSTPVAAVRWGTRPEQHTTRTTLAELATVPLQSPATIVIGAVAGLDLAWFERRPLFGRRVVVTRSREQASSLVERLHDLGAEVLEVPTIRIEENELTVELDGYEWIAFTSANAVDAVCSRLHDTRSFAGAKVAAVGPATADALRRYGVVADLVPPRAIAESLVDAFPVAVGGGRVLVPQAAAARPVLVDGLREKGWSVEVVEAYRTDSVLAAPELVAAAAKADAITFTSSSTVTGYLASAGLEGVPAKVICIGPVTAGTATEAGLSVTAVADPHTIDGLIDAVVGALGN
jgi:uroporphyrinogen III methyltransferase / synthase